MAMREADADTDVLTTILAGVFPAARHLTFHRTLEGVSTPVYRIQADGRIYYLRLAESPKASLVPEAYVHHLLAARAVHIPNVIYFDPFNIALGCSLMITSEIAGAPVDGRVAHPQRRTILMAAGRDLARITASPWRDSAGLIARVVNRMSSGHRIRRVARSSLRHWTITFVGCAMWAP